MSLFPYFLLTSSAVLQISHDFSNALLLTDSSMIALFHSRFDHMLCRCSRLAERFSDFTFVNQAFYQDFRPEMHCIQFEPCMVTLVDPAMILQHVKPEAVAYAHELIPRVQACTPKCCKA